MVEQQLSKTEQQLEQLRAELMVDDLLLSMGMQCLQSGQELETSSTAQLDHVSSQLKETEEALNKEKLTHNETRAMLSHAKEVSNDITLVIM